MNKLSTEVNVIQDVLPSLVKYMYIHIWVT